MTQEERIAELERQVKILRLALWYQEKTNHLIYNHLPPLSVYDLVICYPFTRAINKESKE